MAGRLVRRLVIGGAACVLALALAGTALGTYHDGDSVPPPGGEGDGGEAEVRAVPFNTYENPQVTVDPGDRLFFRNDDLGNPERHNVTSLAGPGRLFRSDTIRAGRRTDVRGVPSLDPGSYNFLCTIHPNEMRGTLTVNGAVLGLQVRPRRARVRAPATQRFRATVRNRGNARTPGGVRVCAARTPGGINVRGRECRSVGALEVGETAQVPFRVRATRRASVGRNKIGFAARSPGARNARAQAVLRVRP